MTTLLLDLETLPEDATVGMDLDHPPGWEPEPHPGFDREVPRNWKDEDKIAVWHAQENARRVTELFGWDAKQIAKAREWFGKKSTNPMELRIGCIGYAFDDEEPEVIECFEEDDRAGLIQLHEICTERRPSRVVAHNGASFDFRVIQLRAMKHGLLDTAARFHQEKPWETYLFDTMLGWPVRYTGMNAICAFLGLGRPDNPIDGKDVLQAYVDGRSDEIVAHCRDDIRVLREVYRVVAKVRGLS